MQLYDCKTAPSPRRVRFFLAEKGLDIPAVEVDLASAEQLGEAFLAINSDATVPVLELDDGSYLTESNAICMYLEEIEPAPALIGTTPAERANTMQWNQKIEINFFWGLAERLRNASPGFKDRALPGRFDYPQIPALAERGFQRAGDYLGVLNERLGEVPYLAGENFTIADITLKVGLDFSQWIKLPVPKSLTHLHDWNKRVQARPAAGV